MFILQHHNWVRRRQPGWWERPWEDELGKPGTKTGEVGAEMHEHTQLGWPWDLVGAGGGGREVSGTWEEGCRKERWDINLENGQLMT